MVVKVSKMPNSVYGEKTAKGIKSKVRRALILNNSHIRVSHLNDLTRATIVVDEYKHIPLVIDLLKRKFPDLRGRIVIMDGYKCVHLYTNKTPGGVCASIHIVTKEQTIPDDMSHGIYTQMRELDKNTEEYLALKKKRKDLYRTFWDEIDFLDTDVIIRSKLLSYGDKSYGNNLDLFPGSLVRLFGRPPYDVIGKKLCPNETLGFQAQVAQGYCLAPQQKLVSVCKGVAEEYTEKKHSFVPMLTAKQAKIYSLFRSAIKSKLHEFRGQGSKNPRAMLSADFGLQLAAIEKIEVVPHI